MADIFSQDLKDFIECLNKYQVRYILIGGYSVIAHGYHRTTGDMDIWPEQSETNYSLLMDAFVEFGMSAFDMTLNRF